MANRRLRLYLIAPPLLPKPRPRRRLVQPLLQIPTAVLALEPNRFNNPLQMLLVLLQSEHARQHDLAVFACFALASRLL